MKPTDDQIKHLDLDLQNKKENEILDYNSCLREIQPVVCDPNGLLNTQERSEINNAHNHHFIHTQSFALLKFL